MDLTIFRHPIISEKSLICYYISCRQCGDSHLGHDRNDTTIASVLSKEVSWLTVFPVTLQIAPLHKETG